MSFRHPLDIVVLDDPAWSTAEVAEHLTASTPTLVLVQPTVLPVTAEHVLARAGGASGVHLPLVKGFEARMAVEMGADEVVLRLNPALAAEELLTELVTVRESVPAPVRLTVGLPAEWSERRRDDVVRVAEAAGVDGLFLTVGEGADANTKANANITTNADANTDVDVVAIAVALDRLTRGRLELTVEAPSEETAVALRSCGVVHRVASAPAPSSQRG